MIQVLHIIAWYPIKEVKDLLHQIFDESSKLYSILASFENKNNEDILSLVVGEANCEGNWDGDMFPGVMDALGEGS